MQTKSTYKGGLKPLLRTMCMYTYTHRTRWRGPYLQLSDPSPFILVVADATVVGGYDGAGRTTDCITGVSAYG